VKLPVDLAVVGSGFGGALTALVARRLGLSVALLERGTHPRFAIGESTSPLANLLLEEIARRYDLPKLLPRSSSPSASGAPGSANTRTWAAA
jgi:FADH2 O2-dependent halogenase